VYEVNGEYLSAAVGYEMRYAPWIVYNHRAPTHDPPSSPVNVPSARQKRPRRAPKRRFRHVTFGPPLQAAVVEWVGHNDAQCTSYGVTILLCKTGDRGGRGFGLDIRRRRRRVSPLRLFFANWPPSQLTPPVAMLHSPTSAKTPRLPCLSFTGAHTSHTKPVA